MQTGAVGQQSTFLVHIRDSFDNPRTTNDVSAITITVNGAAHASTFPYAGTDAYRLAFTPTTAGVLTLRVYVLGVEILGSTFKPVIL